MTEGRASVSRPASAEERGCGDGPPPGTRTCGPGPVPGGRSFLVNEHDGTLRLLVPDAAGADSGR